MRILCSTFGSSGDVFPMLGLALALRDRGHDVTFATSVHYAHMAQEHGLTFESFGTEEQFRESIAHPDVWHPRRSFAQLFRALELVREQQYELFARFHREGPFAGVANCISFGAQIAAEQFGFPLITSHIQPAVLWSDIKPPKLPGLFGSRWLQKYIVRLGEKLYVDPIALPTLNHWRTQLQLPPIRRLTSWWHSSDGVLCMFPEWFGPPQSDWPKPLEQTDFPLWNFQSQQEMPPQVIQFLDSGEPPIVFAPGSANLQAKAFLFTAVETCVRLGRRGILLTEFDEHLPSQMPSTVKRFSYVPLDLLLPRSCALVHHGGIGTASQGLRAGIPQLIMPMAYDQFDNAERLRELGVGLAVPVRSFNPVRVSQALHALLKNPATASNCNAISQRFGSCNGLDRSALAIERLVTQSRKLDA